MKDRLNQLRNKIKNQRLFYSRYNPGSDLLYDVEEADEDFRWMIHEIERLRLENERLQEFVAYTRRELERELGAGDAQSRTRQPGTPQQTRDASAGKTDKKFRAT